MKSHFTKAAGKFNDEHILNGQAQLACLHSILTYDFSVPTDVHQRLNRLLQRIFFALAILFAAYAALFANYLHSNEEPIVRAKMVWATSAAAAFFVIAGLKFSFKTKFKIFAVLLSLLSLEILLQVTAWLGVLPAVNTKLKAPYARIYWTSEGRGNDIRNRYGWHYPEFDLEATNRIAVIGDSFVEAVEVERNQNEAADLQKLLKQKSSDWSVFAFGTHGASPAHYLEEADYAMRHFPPREMIIVLYLGNDINESSPSLDYVPPQDFIYYDLDSSGKLVLNPASAGACAAFDRGMEFSHQPILTTLPVIINSHFMILQMLDSLRDHWNRYRTLPKMAAANPEEAKYGRIALSLKPFISGDPQAQHAIDVMFAELTLLKQKCDAHQIKLRFVTVPYFPPQFYATQHGANWSAKIDKYDFLAPDEKIAAFTEAQGISFLSFADWLKSKKMTAEEIHSLYFTNGSGHFTPLGHELCAEAIFDAFYN